MTTSETKWTPGPWRTDPECGDQSVLGPNGFMVADCAIFSMRKGAPTEGRCRANARLIAAAPALYEALAEAREHIVYLTQDGEDPDDVEALRKIDAALFAARVEG